MQQQSTHKHIPYPRWISARLIGFGGSLRELGHINEAGGLEDWPQG